MQKREEKLESLEEVIQLLIHEITELKNREIKFPEINVPDYTGRFDQIISMLKDLKNDPAIDALKAMMQALEHRIQKIPRQIPVRHHLETRSKGFLITGLLLILTSAFSVGLFAHIWLQNKELKENDLKYRMIHFQFRNASIWADSIYQQDPKAAGRITKELERKERAILQAEAEVRRKETEAIEAQEKADKLKKK